MACNGMSFGFLLPLSLPFRIFKRFIDNFYPVLLIGILYNFIAFQNLLCFLIVHLNKTCKKTRLYINRKTSFLFSTIISF